MFNIPDKINILGCEYKIIECDYPPIKDCPLHWINEDETELLQEYKTGWLGLCCEAIMTIYISKNNMNDFKKQRVLMHEIAHAITQITGIVVPGQLEEVVADCMGNGFYNIFKQLEANKDG